MSEAGLRVLVVDDEPAIRRYLRTALGAHHYQVFEATTGQEALAGTALHRPDVVILDLGLPDLDGVEVTRQLREWTQVPIIILSVRGEEADKIAALDVGADDYLTLVLQFRQLVGEVHREQVAPRRQHLAELDEYRPQRLQRQAQPHRARHRQVAPEKDAGEQPRQALGARLVEDQLVEAEADADADDFQEAEQAQDRAVIGKALILAAFDAATDGRPGAGGYNPPFPGH